MVYGMVYIQSLMSWRHASFSSRRVMPWWPLFWRKGTDGWTDQCWWCSCGRQSREHLFKECRTWKKEIRELWKRVGEISGKGTERPGKARPGRRSKGFGFRSQEYRVGPGNCPVRKLLSEPLFMDAVLDFVEKTDVGKIKRRVIVRGEAVV